MWVSVRGQVCDIENHHAVEIRDDFFAAALHVRVPEFQFSTPFRIPVVVEIEQGIDSPVELRFVVLIEVNVNVQLATRFDLVESTTNEMGVGYDALNSSEFL